MVIAAAATLPALTGAWRQGLLQDPRVTGDQPWRVFARPLALLFIPLHLLAGHPATLIIAGAVAGSLFGLDVYRLIRRAPVRALVRSGEAHRFSSMTGFMVGVFASFLLFSPRHAYFCIAVLALGDFYGKLLGARFGRRPLLGDRTLEGSVGFLLAATLTCALLREAFDLPVAVVLVAPLAATLAELLSTRVDDNLTVPLATGAALLLLAEQELAAIANVVVAMLGGYLYGAVNWATVVNRLVRGVDIRTLGNRKPGTANVAREVGRGWAALVFALYATEGVALMSAAVWLLPADIVSPFTLAAVCAAAVLGHCRPVYYRWQGGGGIATAIGVYLYLVPAGHLVAMVLAAAVVGLFLRRRPYPLGQLIPMGFVALTPLLVWAAAQLPPTQLLGPVAIGGRSWEEVVASAGVSLLVMALNLRMLRERRSQQLR